MSILNIKFPIQLTVKLPKNKFYHIRSSGKLENMLKNVLAIIFTWSPKFSLQYYNSSKKFFLTSY